jgi:hypothetical protein
MSQEINIRSKLEEAMHEAERIGSMLGVEIGASIYEDPHLELWIWPRDYSLFLGFSVRGDEKGFVIRWVIEDYNGVAVGEWHEFIPVFRRELARYLQVWESFYI